GGRSGTPGAAPSGVPGAVPPGAPGSVTPAVPRVGTGPYGGGVRFLPPNGAAAPPPAAPPVPPPAGPQDDVTRGLHRPHGATAAFQVALATLLFVALPGPLLTSLGLVGVLLLTLAAPSGAPAYALVAWWYSGSQLSADPLVVYGGLLRRTTREIPLSRLQAVDVVRPVPAQAVGLAELRIELAGGDASEIRLRYLSRGQAERLRAALLAHAAGLAGTTPEAP